MNITQTFLHAIEEGKAQVLTRLLPMLAILLVIILLFDFHVYHGLNDSQSMDNAQLARQIVRGDGYTTRFIRPYALAQLDSVLAAKKNVSQPDLFANVSFDHPHILPDTYNAPGYPYLLAGWFKLLHPAFDQSAEAIAGAHLYAGDRTIPWLNQIFVLLTAALVFLLGLRLFDQRVAWLSLVTFLISDIVWRYSISALSTSFLMFLITGLLFAALEIFSLGERYAKDEEFPFWPAWLWLLLLSLLLAAACLTRLHLLILLLPLVVFFYFIPRSNIAFSPLLALIVLGLTLPWIWHVYVITGNPLGSNLPLLHFLGSSADANQVSAVFLPPDYNALFSDLSNKELTGFRWHFENAWSLLGWNPLILLFFASILHEFRQLRTQAFRWLLIGALIGIIAVNNLGVTSPEAVDAWNTIVVLYPCFLVVGSAFFFILLDRLNLEMRLVAKCITIILIVITSWPLITSFVTGGAYYNYPPYFPPLLKVLGKATPDNRWITTDMAWGTAWYGDHPSLLLPNTIADFDTIHDQYCNSGLLVLTPFLFSKPMLNLISGDQKDWLPLVTGNLPPAHFPLDSRAASTVGTHDYVIWLNRGGL